VAPKRGRRRVEENLRDRPRKLTKRSREAIVQIKIDFGVRVFNESIRSRDIVIGGVIPELE
jgi:hypothetical protein